MDPLKRPKGVKSTTSNVVSDPGVEPPATILSTDINASQANRSFSSLLRRIAQGQCFTVLSHGRPVGPIAPAEQHRADQGAARALCWPAWRRSARHQPSGLCGRIRYLFGERQ